MRAGFRRITALALTALGLTFASGCDYGGEIGATIELALRIVDVWL